MILLRFPARAGQRLVAVFGTGLIGSSVVAALERKGAIREKEFPISWHDPIERAEHFLAIEAEIVRLLGEGYDEGLQLVWSAGRCGFEASQAEADLEWDGFEAWLHSLERIARRTPGREIRFCLISTAGGLFEGQRHVDRSSQPNPSRPYGRLKLDQEERIQAGGAPWTPAIMRLTAVVGPVGRGHRQGLVSTLVANGLRRWPTRIVGRMETLRDFISVDDVAGFIARRIHRRLDPADPPVMTLASFKPSSLAEIQKRVERVLGRRLDVHYALSPSNEMDITFSPALRPADWMPRDLFATIRDLYQDALTRGVVV